MRRYFQNILIPVIGVLSLFLSRVCWAEVSVNSIFLDARRPASALDLAISATSSRWLESVYHPTEAFKNKFPLYSELR